MLLRRYTGEIVEGNPYCDEIIWYDGPARPQPFLQMVGIIRRHRFDAVVVVHPRLRLALLMAFAGIPLRIGTGFRFYSFLFNRRVYEHRKEAARHELEYNLHLLSPLSCPVPEEIQQADFGVVVRAEEDERAAALLAESGISAGESFVVLHPGSGGSAREWPDRNFAALAMRFGTERVVLTGSPGEESRVEAIVALTGGMAVSLAGRSSVKVLAALLRRADLCIAHSTGPLHLAVAVGTPVVGIYPQLIPMSPRRWGPYSARSRVVVPRKPVDCSECSGAKRHRCSCMESITVDEVYDAAKELLSAGERQRAGGGRGG